MPKRIADEELSAIVEAVGGFGEGVPIDRLMATLELPMPRRTMQRRLALLVERGDLLREGSHRGSRYRVNVTDAAGSKPYGMNDRVSATGQYNAATYASAGAVREGGDAAPTYSERPIPISDPGKEIQAAVQRVIQQRQPVGYKRDFLDAYQPNSTWYLPSTLRERLQDIGSTHRVTLPTMTYSVQIYQRLLIDLAWNSSRLEGNTYSLLETERLIELGKAAEGKEAFETRMILNHKEAIESLVRSSVQMRFNHFTLSHLHSLLAKELLPGDECGRVRQHAVGIGGSVYQPMDGGILLKECLDKALDKASQIENPFEQSFFAMVHLPYLQPFGDVNKRVSRLAANIPLIHNNLSPLSFVDVPTRAYIDGLLGVYELNRTELLADVFAWAYERSCIRYFTRPSKLSEPDRFRMRHGESIDRLVADVVRGGMDKPAAIALIRERAMQEITEAEQARFIEEIETSLMSMHEGNFVCYRLQPSEFASWKSGWV